MTCPGCGRAAASSRATCLYCGAPLPGATPAAVAAPATAPPPGPVADRAVVVLDLRGVEAERLADALGLAVYEARQRAMAGGYQMHKALPAREAESEAARLTAAGLRALVVPPAEAAERGRPLVAHGGRREPGALALQTDEGTVTVSGTDVFLVVRGPITREYQPGTKVRRVRTATLEGSHRLHLHRHSARRPLEIDPLAFDFGDEPLSSLSSLLTVLEWVAAVAPQAPTDDGFRRLTPALGPSVATGGGRLSAVSALGVAGARDAPQPLDNLTQFRGYSAWRAAVEAHGRG
ncbi:MAG: hypothetical protein ABW221_16350 [Vicinamibacteria bacterium]